jgi:uncharacterized membrane protein
MGVSAIAIALHALGAVIWVGGLFFAYVVLRPSLASFEVPARLQLWSAVFERFFVWVWAIILLLLATGYFVVFNVYGGFGASGVHIHLMHLLGIVMMGLFVFLYSVPYGRFRGAIAASDWEGAAGHLNTIRRIVGTNLVLGLVTVAVGASGAFW